MSFGGSVKLTGESEYRAALRKITQELKEVSSEMKLVASAYDKNDRSEEALTARTKALNEQYTAQTKKVEALKNVQKEMDAEYQKQKEELKSLNDQYEKEKSKLSEIASTLGETSSEYKAQAKVVAELANKVADATKADWEAEKGLSNMTIEINRAQSAANKTAHEMDSLGKETEDAGKEAEKSSEGFTIFKGVVANLASEAISKAVDGLKQLGQKFVETAKLSLSSYATYEQVKGGVETMFKDSADVVEKYAEEAYKTAGISANEYMSQVTSFSATLLQGLGGDTAKAAEYADKAITDMSDNANKFGTELSSIQNAYQGFAKQNYTMLDNLKLGYGGTASEMARLVNESGVLGESVKVTATTVKDIPFSSIIDAIHKVQQNLGVTGTTAKEASETIEGSGKSIQASWSNLLTGVASGSKDTAKLTKTLIDNVKTYLKNAVPVIKNIVKNLSKAVMDVLKEFAPGAAKIVQGVVDVVKGLFDFIKNNWKVIVSALAAIGAGFAAFKIASVITAVVTAIKGFISALAAGKTAMAAFSAVASANPFVLLAAGIAAVVVGLIAFSSATSSASKEVEEFCAKQDELVVASAEAAKSFRDARDAATEQAEAEVANINYVETKLLPQLAELVDANGKVKEGEEARAKYILGELNDALGTEYESIQDIVGANGNIKDSIYEVIAAEKARVYLDAYKDSFKEAIKGQETAYENIAAAAQDLSEAEARYKAKHDTIFNSLKQTLKDAPEAAIEWHMRTMTAYDEEYHSLKENVEKKKAAYNDAVEAAGDYESTIQRYNDATTAALEGNYNTAVEILSVYGNTLQTSTSVRGRNAEEQIKILGDQVIREEAAYRILVENHKKSWNTMTETEKEKAKESEEIARKKVVAAKEEYKKVGGTMITAMTEGVDGSKYRLTSEMQKAVNDAVNAAKNAGSETYSVGVNMTKSLADGVRSRQSDIEYAAYSVANSAVNVMKKTMQIASPSKVMKRIGGFFVEGFEVGIKDEARDALRAVSTFGDQAVAAFGSRRGSVTVKGETENMVESFKEALSEMKIELDDKVAGHFVEKTVARAIY